MDPSVRKYLSGIGTSGGRVRSEEKARAARRNGRNGGRPVSVGVRDWSVFFDAVDESRRTRSVSPLRALFVKSRITRERALLAATARHLCVEEFGCEIPEWAIKSIWLKEPWFVSGVENLKAFAILESPPEFRANNIFVLSNFLSRV